MNERRMVEDLVLIGILLKVVKQGVTDLSDPTSIITMRGLQEAATDILNMLFAKGEAEGVEAGPGGR